MDFRRPKSKQIRLVLDGISAEVQHQRDALALEIIDQVSQPPPVGTPVLTGWARAGWLPALDRAVPGGNSFRGKKQPTEGDVKRSLSRQQMAIAELIAKGPAKPEAKAFVGNDRPYINRLNEGHSPQTAAHFFERAIDRAIKIRQLNIQREVISTDHRRPVGLNF